jgi:protein involved in polysaccharide export with SLBB domain
MERWFFAAVCIGLAAAPMACSTGQKTQVAPVVVPDFIAPEESLGVDDVFEVRVFGEESLSGSYRVADDGTVDYPFAGRISVLGKSSGAVQQIITQRLSDGYLKNPQVSVMVKEWNSRKVSVLGQVQKPGAVVYFPSMTIVDAIASAGGFTGIAAPNKVTLRREVAGKVQSTTYPVADISEGKRANVPLVPGDVLVVEERLF